MATFPQSFVDAHEAKLSAGKVKPDAKPVDAFEGKEEELAQLCIAEIRRRRWYFTRNMPGRYSTSTVGTVDLIIAAPNGVAYWAELKKRNGKLSEAQTVTKHVLLSLWHKWGCIYSFQMFVDFIDGKSIE